MKNSNRMEQFKKEILTLFESIIWKYNKNKSQWCNELNVAIVVLTHARKFIVIYYSYYFIYWMISLLPINLIGSGDGYTNSFFFCCCYFIFKNTTTKIYCSSYFQDNLKMCSWIKKWACSSLDGWADPCYARGNERKCSIFFSEFLHSDNIWK